MNPQVRETEQTPIAAGTPLTSAEPVNAIYIAKPVATIKAPSPEVTEDKGPGLLTRRRQRRTRLANRH